MRNYDRGLCKGAATRVVGMLVFGATPAPGMLFGQVASLDTIGRVRIVVNERIVGLGRPPALVFAMETLRQYSCLGFGIEHSFQQQDDTLRVKLLGVRGPEGLCPSALGPATLTRELHLEAGRYAVLISYRSTTEDFTLVLTDSSTALTAIHSTFVEGDTRVHWRFPPRSFALSCENVEVALPVCDDVEHWLVRQRGIAHRPFPPTGLNPYWPYPTRSPDRRVDVFSYSQDPVLEVVRRCFAQVAERIREAVGVALTITTWTGDQITAWSGRSYDQPHITVPENVTAGPECAGHS